MALRLAGAAESGGDASGAINPWFDFDAPQQRQEYQARLAALKSTLEDYQTRARAGESVAIRRMLVANRDAEAAERRHRDLNDCLEDCKRLVKRHVSARRGGVPPAASPFAGGTAGDPLLRHLETAAAELGLDTHLDVNSTATATMTLSSEAILIDIVMSTSADQAVCMERVTVQLMHAQRGLPHVWDDAPELAKRDWGMFRRRLALVVQTAALAAVPVQIAGAKAATPKGAETAALCLEAVEGDIRRLIAQERQLEASSKTTATARLLHGWGLLENAAQAAGAAGTDTSAVSGSTLRALWVYAEPAAFSLAVDQGKLPAAQSSALLDDDSRCLRLATDAGQLGAVRMVLALERGSHRNGFAGAIQAASWIETMSPNLPRAAGQRSDGILSVQFLPLAARATASEVHDCAADAAVLSSVTVSAQLLEPLVVAPRTLAALQSLSAASGDRADPSSFRSYNKRKRNCDDSFCDFSARTSAGDGAVSSLSEMLLPVTASAGTTGCNPSSSSRLHWDVAWQSPSGAGVSAGYRLQRFIASAGRGEDNQTCGLKISRLPCCADVVAWQRMVGLLRQQATWNTLYSSCFRPVATPTAVGGSSDGAVVFELSSNADSTSPELLSLRFVHRTSTATRSLHMVMLTLRISVGGTVEPTLSSSPRTTGSGSDGANATALQELTGELDGLRSELADVLTKTHQLPVALAMLGLGCVAICPCTDACCSSCGIGALFPTSWLI